jgi:hypothetical protein
MAKTASASRRSSVKVGISISALRKAKNQSNEKSIWEKLKDVLTFCEFLEKAFKFLTKVWPVVSILLALFHKKH